MASQEVSSPLKILQQIQTIPNIRDMHEAHPTILPGKVLRCANPMEASQADADLLRYDRNIMHMIDLRSDDERKEDASAKLLEGVTCLRYVRVDGRLQVRKLARPPGAPPLPSRVRVHQLSLLNKGRYFQALLSRVALSTWGSVLFWGLFDRPRSKRALLTHINNGGLEELYQIILETAQPELAAVLKVITLSLERDQPVMFFCKAGKDRTGLVACLLLSCANASREQIILDYVKSDQYHKVALGGIENDPRLDGLDWDVFSRAPGNVIKATLRYLQERYGSVYLYLDKIGFNVKWRRRLNSVLIATPETKEEVVGGESMGVLASSPSILASSPSIGPVIGAPLMDADLADKIEEDAVSVSEEELNGAVEKENTRTLNPKP